MRIALSLLALPALAACATTEAPVLPPEGIAMVSAYGETDPVGSLDDAADDPAIWVNAADPAASRVLGTDKRAGLYVYDLNGAEQQFLPSGELNNVDVRQGVSVPGLEGDLAAATNRTDESVTFFSIDATGALTEIARMPVLTPEPYGFCLGWDGQMIRAYVTYKDGLVQDWAVAGFADGAADAGLARTWKLSSQLEGCAADETHGALYIGEENLALWRLPLDGGEMVMIDPVGGETGLTDDIEGIDVYEGADGAGYVVVSSQGSSSFHLYDRQFAAAAPNAFVGRFGIVLGEDIVTGTDGLDVSSAPLGANLPEGIMIVQDDANTHPDAAQNYKLIDWRAVRAALGL